MTEDERKAAYWERKRSRAKHVQRRNMIETARQLDPEEMAAIAFSAASVSRLETERRIRAILKNRNQTP